MSTHQHEPPDPDTELNIPKAAKKSFIAWVVPALCIALMMAVFTVVKSWADDRYRMKTTAESDLSAVNARIDDEQKRREALGSDLQNMDRKLDLIIYILQRDGKLSPQDMNGKDMKGKLSSP